MIQTKKCKGQGNASGYDACGKDTDTRRRKFGLCPACLWDWMSNDERGKIWKLKQFIPKVTSKVETIKKERTKAQKEANKTISQLIGEAKVPFQKWIRLRDANRSCVSCGSTDSEIWDGGHFYKAELYTGLIFDENNCHKQCRKCNGYLGGNENNYRLGLIERYGIEFVKKLDEKSINNRTKVFERDELYEIKKNYQDKLKTINL